jgi:hypothetical protein
MASQQVARGGEMNGVEALEAIAVSGRRLGKQHDILARGHARRHRGVDGRQTETRVAIDEDRVLHAGEQAEARPAGDLRLGDKAEGTPRTKDQNIRPGHMIGDKKPRRPAARSAALDNAQTQNGAKRAADEDGDATAHGPIEPSRQGLKRRDESQHDSEDDSEQSGADIGHTRASTPRP